MRALWLAVGCLVAMTLGGCARLIDGEQERLCRQVIPAVIDTEPGVTLLGSEPGAAGEVFIAFRIAGEDHGHFVFCRFAGSGFSFRKRVLTHVGLDGTSLSDAATFFLRERWLTTQDAVAEEPQSQAAGRSGPALSQPVAYGLQQTLSGLPKLGIYALLAASYALIFGLVGRINLAFGAFAVLGGTIAVLAILLFDQTGLAALPYGLIAGFWITWVSVALYGTGIARLVIRPMAFRSGQSVLIASIGLAMLLSEGVRVLQGAQTLWLPPVLSAPIRVAQGPAFDVTLTPMALLTALMAMATAMALLGMIRFSRFGRDCRAASEDAVAAELFGIDTADVLGQSFALAAALAGFAGMLVTLLYGGIGFAGGTHLGLTALVAAVLGGIGSVGAAMAGGALIGLFEVAWSALMPIEHRDAALYSLLSLALIFWPNGLFGGRDPGPMRV